MCHAHRGRRHGRGWWIFRGRLAAAGTDVAFLRQGRPPCRAAIARGLRIVSPKGDVHVPRVTATDNPSDIGAVDVVLFTVKLYDVDAALTLLPPLVGPNTVVLPLQNGVDGVDIVTRAVGRDHAGGGTCYVSAMISEPGVIKHTAMDHLIFGEVDGSRSARLERLLEACSKTNFQTTLSDNITVDIWTKFTRLSVLERHDRPSPARRSASSSTIRSLFAMLKAAVAEAVAVAHARRAWP